MVKTKNVFLESTNDADNEHSDNVNYLEQIKETDKLFS